MSVEVLMPKFGMTMKEGEIVKWHKKVGDQVEKGEVLVEIMSDKITNGLEAQASGELSKIILKEGERGTIGSAIAVIS